MFFFFPTATAWAADAPAQSLFGSWTGMLPLVAMFVIFYFLLIRPQQKRAKEHRQMLSQIQKGDSVITTSGMYGRVVSVADDSVVLEIADNVKVKFSKDAVNSRKA